MAIFKNKINEIVVTDYTVGYYIIIIIHNVTEEIIEHSFYKQLKVTDYDAAF